MKDALDTSQTAGQPIANEVLRPDTRSQNVRVRRAGMLTVAFGVAHALILLTAFWLIKVRTPDVRASNDQVVAFYSNADNRRIVLLAGIYLIPFAAIAFIWFTVALRMWASLTMEQLNVLFANIQLVAGIIYITLIMAAGASMSILATSLELSHEPFDPIFGRQFPQFGRTLFLILAMRMAAMFVFSTTSLFRRTGLVPRWFLLIGGVVGLALLLSASVSSWLVLVFPGWVLVLCLFLFNHVRKIPRELEITVSPAMTTGRIVLPASGTSAEAGQQSSSSATAYMTQNHDEM